MPHRKISQAMALSKSVISKKALPKPKTPGIQNIELFAKSGEKPKGTISKRGRKKVAAKAPITLRSYGNLNRVIARNILVSVDIENRKPQGVTEEMLASSLLNMRPEDSLTKKIKSRRLNA